MNIKVDFDNVQISEKEIMKFDKSIKEFATDLESRSAKEDDFVGWLHLPTNYDKEEFERIKVAAKKIQENSDVFIVIGIGGSYLGARAVIESLSHTFSNLQSKDVIKKRQPSNNTKSDKLEVEGKVVDVTKGGDYIVELPNGYTVEAYVSGKMRVNMIRILPGDTVTIELSPYDLTRGRITWNKR